MSGKMKTIAMFTVLMLMVGSLSGCATTGKDHWSDGKKGSIFGAIGGAIGGATIGLLKGGLEGALIGAAAGAVAGAVVGGVIDYYQYKKAPEVVKEYGSSKQLALEDMSISKDVFKDGDKGNLNVKYVVINPDDIDKKNTVKQTIEISKGDKVVLSKEDSKDVATGGYQMSFPIEIPKGADEGDYKVTAKLEAPDIDRKVSETRSFRVFYARNNQGVLYLAQVTPY